MKPELSFARIGSLPSFFANSNARLDGLVARRDRAHDLDQLHQRHRVEEVQADHPVRAPQAAAIAAIVRLDVFDAKIVSGGQTSFSSFHIAFFISRSSTTASMTMSHVAQLRELGRERKLRERRVALLGSDLSLLDSFRENLLDAARATSRSERSETSRTTGLESGLSADTCAMPLPISPPPSTPTFRDFASLQFSA